MSFLPVVFGIKWPPAFVSCCAAELMLESVAEVPAIVKGLLA